MTNMTQYAGNQGDNFPNTQRNPSPYIWGDCPWREIQDGTVDGVAIYDNFVNLALTVPTTQANFGLWKGFTSTGGGLAPATSGFGGLVLSSDDDDEGASIATVGLPFKLSRASGKFWYEAYVKVSTIADTKFDFFAGLVEQQTLTATVPITATTPVLADHNLVGFQRLGTDGDYFDAKYKANGVTAVTAVSDAQVIAADTYIKLGMKYDPADFYLRFYGNGVLLGSKEIPSTDGDDFPNDVNMGLCFALLNAAAAGGTATVGWVKAAQVAAG